MHITLINCGHQIDGLYGMMTGLRNDTKNHYHIIDAERDEFDLDQIGANNITVYRFLKKTQKPTFFSLASNWFVYYLRLTKFILTNPSKVYHIEWINRKIAIFEHIYFYILLTLWNKKIVYKVHDLDTDNLLSNNISQNSSLVWHKKFFFSYVNRFIVLNEIMKKNLISLGIDDHKVSVIAHGVNNYQPSELVDITLARDKLEIPKSSKVLLFFGNIRKYKGLDHLLNSFNEISTRYTDLYLLISGKFDKTLTTEYRKSLQKKIDASPNADRIISHLRFINTEEVPTFFSASDVLILPYEFIYQSGVPFLSFALGTPVITNNVGGISVDIIDGFNGYVYEGNENLSKTLEGYLEGRISFRDSKYIIEHVNEEYSWDKLMGRHVEVYYDSLTSNN